jgi:hypothetical protein
MLDQEVQLAMAHLLPLPAHEHPMRPPRRIGAKASVIGLAVTLMHLDTSLHAPPGLLLDIHAAICSDPTTKSTPPCRPWRFTAPLHGNRATSPRPGR